MASTSSRSPTADHAGLRNPTALGLFRGSSHVKLPIARFRHHQSRSLQLRNQVQELRHLYRIYTEFMAYTKPLSLKVVVLVEKEITKLFKRELRHQLCICRGILVWIHGSQSKIRHLSLLKGNSIELIMRATYGQRATTTRPSLSFALTLAPHDYNHSQRWLIAKIHFGG